MNPKLVLSKRIAEIRQRATDMVCVTEHDPFQIMLEERHSALALSQLRLPECRHQQPCGECRKKRRRQIVASYDASVKEVRTLHHQLATLLRGIVEAYVFPGEGDQQRKLYQQKLSEMLSKAAPPPLEIADALFAEIMVLEEAEIINILSDALLETVERTLTSFRRTLERFWASGICGKIKWLSRDVCRYDFYRVRRSEQKVGESRAMRTETTDTRSVGGNTWTEFEVVMRTNHYQISDALEHHAHELFNAARYAFPAPAVPKPRHVLRLWPKISSWMHHHLFVVEGDMLRESVDTIEKPVGTRDMTEEVSRRVVRSGVLYSPAVTLGDYVLTGWSKADC